MRKSVSYREHNYLFYFKIQNYDCLENFAKDIEGQDGYFKVLEDDTEELRRELITLKEMCENIEQQNRTQRVTNCDPIWTISSDSLQRTVDSSYGSHDGNTVAMYEESYSERSSIEKEFKGKVISFDDNESSLAKELSIVDYTYMPPICGQNMEYSNDRVSLQINSTGVESVNNSYQQGCYLFPSDKADKVDSKAVESDVHLKHFDEIEIICNQPETSSDISRHQNSSSKDSLDINEVKVCISETSTAETLKCESLIDLLSDHDQKGQKDTYSTKKTCLDNLLYYLLSICSHVFD